MKPKKHRKQDNRSRTKRDASAGQLVAELLELDELKQVSGGICQLCRCRNDV